MGIVTWKCPHCGSEFDTDIPRTVVRCWCRGPDRFTPMTMLEADVDICDGYVLRVVPPCL